MASAFTKGEKEQIRESESFKDMKKHQARLVHHSVKEFVLKKFALPHGQISKEPDEIMLNRSIRGAGLRDNLDAVEYFVSQNKFARSDL